MDKTIVGGPRTGVVKVPASKSRAHRMLISAALSLHESVLAVDGLSDDIRATAACLTALGAGISFRGDTITVRPITELPKGEAVLPCGESGSTLRFLLPIVGALGVKAAFSLRGRLPERPLSPFKEELIAHGMSIVQTGDTLRVSGRLESGAFRLPGDVSSQFISGLLFALPILKGDSRLLIEGRIESEDYVRMTEEQLLQSGVLAERMDGGWQIKGAQRYNAPAHSTAEADWSNAAFFLCMGALSRRGVCVTGLDPSSSQGDRAILEILKCVGAHVEVGEGAVTVRRGELLPVTVDASAIPDLVPALGALLSVCEGESRVVNAARLRMKESDRLKTTREMLCALGADVNETPDGLVIRGQSFLPGGEAESANDHRIAMASAVAACLSGGAIIKNAECVSKSYPEFWTHFDSLEADT
ncbi:MAG: 3-phosphoshikimate 1-carboxyvinyltransferase [Clostridia bacterium]|nr:3-phosphoshikimate 1-carboxyvinyltransferase [Clostridia bacterium]